MDNSGSWTRNKRNRGGRGNGQQRKRSQRNSRPERRERQFPKFVDNIHGNNVTNNRRKTDWNCSSKNKFNSNGPVDGPGIYPWIRQKPANPLIIPGHITFDHDNDYQEFSGTNQTVNKKAEAAYVQKSTEHQTSDKEINVCKSGNGCESANNTSAAIGTFNSAVVPNMSVKIKQEKDLVNLKQERKSSSSSSSSDSSNEGEPEPKIKQADAAKSVVTASSRLPSPTLNIKLKPKIVPVTSPPVKTQTLEATSKDSSSSSSSSSSTSSSDESSSPHTSPPRKSSVKTNKTDKMDVPTKGVRSKSTAVKNNSEDDVVCMGNLENKIVLEDEDDHHKSPEKNYNKTKKSGKNTTAEKCMICDKKGHTSFECQMICKNCNAPYHGYRTCPQPANLNTMLQIFIEFCMQQFQSFKVEKQTEKNPYDSVPKPQVDSQPLPTPSNKSNKIKRKPIKTNEISKKSKTFKKRKTSASKKTKTKSDSDDDNEEDDTDSKSSSTDSEEEISDSSVESLVSSKRKRKMKSKTSSKAALNIPNLPMVFNGFPHLTVPTASIPNTNPSTNALNTLLLTQMFQNAIGSLKK